MEPSLRSNVSVVSFRGDRFIHLGEGIGRIRVRFSFIQREGLSFKFGGLGGVLSFIGGLGYMGDIFRGKGGVVWVGSAVVGGERVRLVWIRVGVSGDRDREGVGVFR